MFNTAQDHKVQTTNSLGDSLLQIKQELTKCVRNLS